MDPMPTHRWALFAAIGALSLLSCAKERAAIPPGPLLGDRIAYRFVVYSTGRPLQDPMAALEVLLKDKAFPFRRVKEQEVPKEGLALAVSRVTDARNSLRLPSADSLHKYGQGLDAGQATAMARTDQALVLDFGYREKHVWDGLKAATLLTSRLAHETGGLIWDVESREAFTPAAWDEKRLDSWTEDVPPVSNHFVVHAYQDGEYVRAVSVGLTKIGLPDLVVEPTSWSSSDCTTSLIDLLAQALAEGQVVGPGGRFDLDLRKIRNAGVRDPQLKSLKKGGTGIARLVLRQGVRDEGDADNRLVAIAFDRYTGEDLPSRLAAAIGGFFGGEDEAQKVEHDEELLAASRRAREKLPALHAAFNRGLPPGEYIMLKAPFPIAKGGREWMWVEVTSWSGDEIHGVLSNEPTGALELKLGQAVKVSEDEVLDYLHRFSGGKEEGNLTGAVITKREGLKPAR